MASKRPATTPFASPSKAASKKSRTQYDYGDEDNAESVPEDRWSAEDADSMMLDDDDDNGHFGGEPRYQEDLKTTEVSRQLTYTVYIS